VYANVEYVQRVSRFRHVARTYWLEALVAALGIEAMVHVLVAGESVGLRSLWFDLVAIPILVAPLLARRRFPFWGPLAYWVIAAGISLIDPIVIPYAQSLFPVGMAAAFLLGNLRDAGQAAVGLAVIVGSMLVLVNEIPGHRSAELVFVPLEFAIVWLAGFALRERTQQAEAAEVRAMLAERERDAAARIAVAEERARIARELHDIVAHSVSVMVLQVGAVRHRLPQGDDSEALKGVERAGRTALAEMRRLLAAMRTDGDAVEFTPQPGLDELNSLLDEIERAGLPVTLHVDGEAFPLPRAIDLSAYRIVQEGLTNALKHSRATKADVTVRYRTDEVQLEIRDNGSGTATGDGLGHGLVGIRERVKIYGGEMSAGTANGGGWVLSTRLPLTSDRP
jgi:signal transduction histidine kinase